MDSTASEHTVATIGIDIGKNTFLLWGVRFAVFAGTALTSAQMLKATGS